MLLQQSHQMLIKMLNLLSIIKLKNNIILSYYYLNLILLTKFLRFKGFPIHMYVNKIKHMHINEQKK